MLIGALFAGAGGLELGVPGLLARFLGYPTPGIVQIHDRIVY